MRKVIIISAVFLLCFSLVCIFGCGSNKESSSAIEEQSPTYTQEEEETSSEPKEPTTQETTKEISFKLTADDWTETSDNTSVEIWVKDTGSWYPDLTYGGDFTVIGPFSVGAPQELFIYPDGREGKEISAVFTPESTMISESDRDTIHVELYDGHILVWGAAFQPVEKEFSRF